MQEARSIMLYLEKSRNQHVRRPCTTRLASRWAVGCYESGRSNSHGSHANLAGSLKAACRKSLLISNSDANGQQYIHYYRSAQQSRPRQVKVSARSTIRPYPGLTRRPQDANRASLKHRTWPQDFYSTFLYSPCFLVTHALYANRHMVTVEHAGCVELLWLGRRVQALARPFSIQAIFTTRSPAYNATMINRMNEILEIIMKFPMRSCRSQIPSPATWHDPQQKSDAPTHTK